MKKIMILLFATVMINIANGQSCLPEGITFTTQAQIDSFQTNYPGCNEIHGDVTISGADITNLDGLNVLTTIGGNLSVIYNSILPDLSGLENLNSIERDCCIYDNKKLTSLAGLESLKSVGGGFYIGYLWVQVVGNPELASITGLKALTTIGGGLCIAGAGALTSLNGLDNLTSAAWLNIIGNPFTSLTGLNKLTSIPSLLIYNNHKITSLNGLEGLTNIGALSISGNSKITSLNGLEGLTNIGALSISGNAAMVSLIGIEGITKFKGGLSIFDNAALTNLTGLDNIDSIGGNFWISQNPALSSLSGLNALKFIGGWIEIDKNENLAECDIHSLCNYLASPNAIILIYNNAPGCNSQAEVEAACNAVSVNDLKPADGFSIYPDPAYHKISIATNRNLHGEITISIYSMNGALLKQEIFQNQILIELDVSTLAKGIYLVKIHTSAVIETKKLVIH